MYTGAHIESRHSSGYQSRHDVQETLKAGTAVGERDGTTDWRTGCGHRHPRRSLQRRPCGRKGRAHTVPPSPSRNSVAVVPLRCGLQLLCRSRTGEVEKNWRLKEQRGVAPWDIVASCSVSLIRLIRCRSASGPHTMPGHSHNEGEPIVKQGRWLTRVAAAGAATIEVHPKRRIS